MNCIQNSCINTPTPLNKTIAGFACVLVITAIAIAVIGLTASSGGPFNAIVALGSTTNGILLGTSIFVLILDLLWIATLCKKKNTSLVQSEPTQPPSFPSQSFVTRGSVIVDNSEIENPIGERLDPVVHLPEEAFFKILSYLNENELGRSSLVSKEWKRIASDEALWKPLYPKIAFGKEKWATHFGVIGEEPPLPPNIHQILKSRPRFLNGKSVEETHMLVLIPSSINGKPLTLNSIGDLVESPLQGHKTGYRYIWSEMFTEHGEKSVNASYWVLMSKDVLPKSRNKNYSAQQELVKKYAEIAQVEYRIPNALEAVVCIFTEFVSSGKRLYSDTPWTYTRCPDKAKGYQVVVGGFTLAGLDIGGSNFVDDGLGIGVLRKF